jgi:transcriptional regulator with XRE-family HTH domain
LPRGKPREIDPRLPYSLPNIAYRLSLTRQALGLASGEMAKLLGVVHNRYSQWESGTAAPRIDAAALLCDQFGLTLDWLFRGVQAGLRIELVLQIKAIEVEVLDLARHQRNVKVQIPSIIAGRKRRLVENGEIPDWLIVTKSD